MRGSHAIQEGLLIVAGTLATCGTAAVVGLLV